MNPPTFARWCFSRAYYDIVRIVPSDRGTYAEGASSIGNHMAIKQSRLLFSTAMLLVVSCPGSSQSQSAAPSSAADLVKAVIRTELNHPEATQIRWKYLLDNEV